MDIKGTCVEAWDTDEHGWTRRRRIWSLIKQRKEASEVFQTSDAWILVKTDRKMGRRCTQKWYG
jgi:hypothetical protein